MIVESIEIVDSATLDKTVKRFAERNIKLPTLAQLADPSSIPPQDLACLAGLDSNTPDAGNLWRVHWHNQLGLPDSFAAVPEHVVIPPAMSGVESPIAVVFGNRFPMIKAHKVLAAYACLVPRLVTGRFDPTWQRAVWPSTGNYARGGVAISRIMGCRGVAVLPENMSRERFAWLEQWVENQAEDIVRTPGSESNVKEIYDQCAELDASDQNFIFNQFSEFPNYLAHYQVTGRALERVVDRLLAGGDSSANSHLPDNLQLADDGNSANSQLSDNLQLAAFVSASGSAGTLGAGDYLKEKHGCQIVAVEALECPTMLYNGFGEHNIQGIGDKHIPLIHNVMNTDLVVGVSDEVTDSLFMVCATEAGKSRLRDQGVAEEVIQSLRHFGFSSWCNLLAAIKAAKQLQLGPDQLIITIATDGSELYESERTRLTKTRFGGQLSDAAAQQAIDQHLLGATTDHTEVLDAKGRDRVFNLGYFTWVEQQGVSVEDFVARREPGFWQQLHSLSPVLDDAIVEFNQRTGV